MVGKTNSLRVGELVTSEHHEILVSPMDGGIILQKDKSCNDAVGNEGGFEQFDEPTLANVLAHCRGIHARVAETIGVDPSYVSRVAGGSRNNGKVSDALREELRALGESINSLLNKEA